MWHIWDRLRNFCTELDTFRRIPQLTVKFVENDEMQWATEGLLNTTLRIIPIRMITWHSDMEQLLLTIRHFVTNVDKPKILLPGPCTNGLYSKDDLEFWQGNTEFRMSSYWHCDVTRQEYDDLEQAMKERFYGAHLETGIISSHIFQQRFGDLTYLKDQNYEICVRELPCMEYLDDWRRPRVWDMGPPLHLYQIQFPPPEANQGRRWSKARISQWQGRSILKYQETAETSMFYFLQNLAFRIVGF